MSGGSGTSGISGDTSGSEQSITFSGHTDILSGDQSASGSAQEAVEGSTVTFTSGEPGSASGSGDVADVQQSGFSASGSGFTSGSGDISGTGDDLVILMVNGEMVEMSKTQQKSMEQRLGSGHIELFESSVSGSGSAYGSASGGFSGISFIDHSGADLTVQLSGEQELSGHQPSGSGFPSGFPSGLASGSASASGDLLPEHDEIIFFTDDEMTEMSVEAKDHSPAAGRGVVEISGQGSGSGIHRDFSGILDQSLDLSGSGFLHVVTPDTASTSLSTVPSVTLATPAVVAQPEIEEGNMTFQGPVSRCKHISFC